jgi:hypothetical protein
MQENDYQSLYRLFHTFTACNNKATHSIRAENEIAECAEDRLCYTTDGAYLFLCQDCLKFWQECRRMRDRSTWEMAVFLRESRAERQT